MASQAGNKNDYVQKLIEEKKNLNSQHSIAHKLLQQEIDRVRSNGTTDSQKNDSHVVVHKGKQIRLKVKVHIPVEENPNFNFVGKLLGPKGSSLQQLQEATQTRMAILGKGSMRDKKKEDELRSQGDPKYSHLHEDLHVEVSAFAPAAEAYRRVSLAFVELQRFLIPDVPGPFQGQDQYNDDMRQPQYDGRKPPYAGEGPPMAPRGGPPPRAMGPPLMQGREPPPPRRAQSSYPAAEVDEWAPAPPRAAPRRGGYGGGAPPPARSAPPPRAYEEPASDYNNYGDGYGDGYGNSGNSSGYYDYPAEPEPSYADGYGEERAPPMRNAGGAPRGRSNARVAAHPYAGATRRGY